MGAGEESHKVQTLCLHRSPSKYQANGNCSYQMGGEGRTVMKEIKTPGAPPILVHHCLLDLQNTPEAHFSINGYWDENLDWLMRHKQKIQKILKSSLKNIFRSLALGHEARPRQPEDKGRDAGAGP